MGWAGFSNWPALHFDGQSLVRWKRNKNKMDTEIIRWMLNPGVCRQLECNNQALKFPRNVHRAGQNNASIPLLATWCLHTQTKRQTMQPILSVPLLNNCHCFLLPQQWNTNQCLHKTSVPSNQSTQTYNQLLEWKHKPTKTHLICTQGERYYSIVRFNLVTYCSFSLSQYGENFR